MKTYNVSLKEKVDNVSYKLVLEKNLLTLYVY